MCAAAVLVMAEGTSAGQGPQGPKIKHTDPETQFKWEDHVRGLTEKQFRLRYRLTHQAFYELRDLLACELNKSDDKFATISKGYPIGLNVKLAVALRMLAGADYKDLQVIYQISSTATIYYCMWLVVDAVNTKLGMHFPHNDESKLAVLEAEFRSISRTKGQVWKGQVTAVDGVLFKMTKPPKHIRNSGRYHVDRKHMFALLCIAGCDAYRRFQFYDISQVSTTHDSLAFLATPEGRAIQQGLPEPYFASGDSAFVRSESMIIPSNTDDAFDWCQSSNRMPIECAFGILIRRWGILWRPLACKFEQRAALIGCLMRLHNFCIDKGIDEEAKSVSIINGRGEVQPDRWRRAPKFDKEGRPVTFLEGANNFRLGSPMLALAPPDEMRNRNQDRLMQAIKEAGIVRPPLTGNRKRKQPINRG